MISAGDFRNGITLEIDNAVYQIIEFQHVKPGKGAAFVRTKIKNVMTGAVTERTFRPTEKFPAARIDRVELKFVKENEMVKVVSYNGNVFSVEPPLFVELEVTETEPGFAGNTATGAQKPAIVETGAQISVPLFVGIGDRVKIDTRTGEYLGRAQN